MKKVAILAGFILIIVAFNGFRDRSIQLESVKPTDKVTAQVPENNRKNINQKLASKTNTQAALLHKSNTFERSTEIELLKRSEEKKNEIELLMLKFDTNKSNKDQRQAIKIKMDKAMQEYNKLILPIALSQINNNQ
jgi:hypothetical protein